MFRALVVDDERLARDRIIALLEQDDDITVIGECGSGTEAIQQINRQKPDIVFLDIEIPDADAFEVLEAIDSDIHPFIIFVTAYVKYLKQQKPIDDMTCLLKPFNAGRFQQVINSVKKRLNTNNDAIRLKL